MYGFLNVLRLPSRYPNRYFHSYGGGMDQVYIDITAYHEAAHAVVALYHGRGVEEVAVSMTEPGNGWTQMSVAEKLLLDDLAPGNIRAAWLRTEAIYSAWIRILLAGPLAEAKLLNKPLRSLGARSDLIRAQRLFERLQAIHAGLTMYASLPMAIPETRRDVFRRETRQLVARPRIWRMITALAQELIQRESVTADELTGILQTIPHPHGQYGLLSGLKQPSPA